MRLIFNRNTTEIDFVTYCTFLSACKFKHLFKLLRKPKDVCIRSTCIQYILYMKLLKRFSYQKIVSHIRLCVIVHYARSIYSSLLYSARIEIKIFFFFTLTFLDLNQPSVPNFKYIWSKN